MLSMPPPRLLLVPSSLAALLGARSRKL